MQHQQPTRPPPAQRQRGNTRYYQPSHPLTSFIDIWSWSATINIVRYLLSRAFRDVAPKLSLLIVYITVLPIYTSSASEFHSFLFDFADFTLGLIGDCACRAVVWLYWSVSVMWLVMLQRGWVNLLSSLLDQSTLQSLLGTTSSWGVCHSALNQVSLAGSNIIKWMDHSWTRTTDSATSH